MSIQVCLISQININYNENSGKKSFSSKPKHQYHVSQQGEHDCSAHNKQNGDDYKYPSLTYFTNEYLFQGKWWKEKLVLQIQSINVMYHIVENVIVVSITNSVKIIISIQICLISWMNINYKEKGGKKIFSYESKASISCIPMRRT